MSLDIDLYKSRLNAYKVTGKNGKIDSIKKQILDDFIGNPSHEEVVISDIVRDVHIVSEGQKGLRLLCKPSEDINAGEYIIWNNKHFLCTYRFPDDKVQTKGTIQKCNHDLKWICDKTGELIIKHCIEDARTLYTTGIKDEKVIEIPNGMSGIQLPYDNDTKELDRGSEFVFNKTKYKVTHYDDTTYEGLVLLICSEEAKAGHLDDMANQIANRWIEIDGEKIDRLPWLDNQEPPIEPEPTEPTEGVTYAITSIDAYDKTDVVEIWANSWAKFTVHKFIDDVEVSGIFTFEIDNINLATITVDGNTATITAKDVRRGGDVKLTVIDTETDEIAIEQIIKIVGY